MSEYQEPVQVTSAGTPRWVGIALIVLAVVSVLGIGIGWSALNHAKGVEEQTQASVKQANDALAQKLAKEDEINQQLQSDLKVVTDKLNVTQSDLVKARKQNRQSSAAVDKKIAGLENSVNTQLAAKANAEDFNKLNTDVTGVKSDLDATKNNLQMARSEMGTLIARNHDEIDQLRRLGEREYVEFTIAGKNKPQKVGNLTVELKGVNQKRNQYSVVMVVEDKRFEKKNRALNEPVFFYTSGTRLPEELVINKVSKDQVSGYVSIPKANTQQAAAATSTSGN
jgi:hypothetical protein